MKTVDKNDAFDEYREARNNGHRGRCVTLEHLQDVYDVPPDQAEKLVDQIPRVRLEAIGEAYNLGLSDLCESISDLYFEIR